MDGNITTTTTTQDHIHQNKRGCGHVDQMLDREGGREVLAF